MDMKTPTIEGSIPRTLLNVSRDSIDTIAEPRGDGDPTRVDTLKTLGTAESSTAALPNPETVLLRAEIEQMRQITMGGIFFNALGFVVAPLFGGDDLAARMSGTSRG